MFDEWPDEPDEPDPEEGLGSPEENLVEVPSVPEPEVEEADVDPELLTTWWRSVALANIALGAVAIGLLLVAFRGQWLVGGAGVVLGLLAGARLYQHYRAFERRQAVDGEADEGDADGGANEDDANDDAAERASRVDERNA